MVDQQHDNRDDFVISENKDDAEDLRREDYYNNHTSAFQKKSKMPFIIGGVAIAVLIILFNILMSGSGNVVNKEQLQALEARIQQLEGKLATIGVMDQALDRLVKQEQEFSLLNKRVNRFEATVTSQIDQIIKELGALYQKTAQPQTPKAKPPQPVVTIQKETKLKFHQVMAGETLYGISRRYGLTVERLRSYNNIGPNDSIQPGQKLKLSPN